jgi:CheY-like chemotaxis protein
MGSPTPQVLIAEDDPLVAGMLEHALGTLDCTAHVTASPAEARRWLELGGGPLVLDGSVLARMRIPLQELPPRVIIWSGDDTLVERARRCGLRAFGKGDAAELDGLVREVTGRA